jgi:hypothetical protein
LALTPDQQRAALLDALRPFREDFFHYAPRALKIRTKSGTISPFVPNIAQVFIHSQIENQRREFGKVRALVLKGRQQGASTYIEGRFYWRVSLTVGQRALVLTHLGDSTDALFEMAKRYHELCPEVLRPHTGASNAKELIFDQLDSGYVVGTAGSSKGLGRGRTFQFLHASEFAFWDNAAEHMAGLGQTVPDMPGSEIIKESTANGVGNPFHQDWQAAERGESDYVPIFVPWFWDTDYMRERPRGFSLSAEESAYMQRYRLSDEQMAWRRAKLNDDMRGDVDLFDQEYPAEPLLAFKKVSGDPLIAQTLVTRAQDPALVVEATGPRIMGVDPAEYGDDATAIAMRQGRVVEPIKRMYKAGPMDVVGMVAHMADKWKPDAINVDATGIGSGVADRLRELNYPVNRIMFGGKPTRDELYVIKRDEIWGDTLAWLQDWPCKLPKDDVLASDLCGPQYSYDSSRRLRVESKEQMRKRGIKSPDSGDAVALTHATPFASYAGASNVVSSYKAARAQRRPM